MKVDSLLTYFGKGNVRKLVECQIPLLPCLTTQLSSVYPPRRHGSHAHSVTEEYNDVLGNISVQLKCESCGQGVLSYLVPIRLPLN